MSRACEKQWALWGLEEPLARIGLDSEGISRFQKDIIDNYTSSYGISVISEMLRRAAGKVDRLSAEVERLRAEGRKNGEERFNAGCDSMKEYILKAIAELPPPGPNDPGNDRSTAPGRTDH